MTEEQPGTIFQRKLSSSDTESKLNILSILAHSITVEVRGVFIAKTASYETTLYSLNEIQHQITARIMNLLRNEDEWNEGEFVSMLYDYADEGNCNGGLNFAIQQTLNASNKKAEDKS